MIEEKPKTNFDYSKFDLYKKCPQSYKWKYVEFKKPKAPPNRYYALIGIVIQKMFELFYNNEWYLKRSACREFMYSKAPEIYEDTLKWCHVDWQAKIAKKSKHVIYDEFLEMIGKNLDVVKEKKLLGKYAKSEVKLTSYFEKNNYVVLTSKVDFIIHNQEGIQILDGKATSNKKGYLDNPAQLYFYAMMHHFKYKTYPDKIGFWFYKTGEIVYVDFTPEKVEELKENLKDVLYKIYKKKFEATPSYSTCLFCDYRDECLERLKGEAEKSAEKSVKITEDDMKAFL